MFSGTEISDAKPTANVSNFPETISPRDAVVQVDHYSDREIDFSVNAAHMYKRSSPHASTPSRWPPYSVLFIGNFRVVTPGVPTKSPVLTPSCCGLEKSNPPTRVDFRRKFSVAVLTNALRLLLKTSDICFFIKHAGLSLENF